jgi:hypothetical protein
VEKRKIQSKNLMAVRRAKLREMGFVRIEVTVAAADVDKVREFVASLQQPPAQMDHTDAHKFADQH